MKDLSFNINTRELEVVNGQISITKDSSVQNGGIIKDTRCINVLSPILGVGFNPINSQMNENISELNRWKAQCKSDGAKVANYTATSTGITNTILNVDINISY